MTETVPSSAPVPVVDLQRSQDPQDRGRDVDEDGLVEAGGEVGSGGEPGEVGVPQGGRAEVKHL